MAEVRVHLYEGLFLLNQQHASADFGATVQFVRDVLARAEAEVIALRKWDERKLAYEIKGQKRGVYLLAYFRARGTQIANIERDCSLSEQVLRCLITRGDHLGEAELELAKKDADLSLEARLRGSDDRDRDRDRDRGDRDRGDRDRGDRDRGDRDRGDRGGRRGDVTVADEEGARTPREESGGGEADAPDTATTVEGSRVEEPSAGTRAS